MSWMLSGRMDLTADVIYACGPTPMLRALKAYAAGTGYRVLDFHGRDVWPAESVPVWPVSASQKRWMTHSHVHNKRVCKDGPVFLADGGGTVNEIQK